MDVVTRNRRDHAKRSDGIYQVLQIVAVTFVAVALSFTLAHAVELPGKMRLSKEMYLAVQPIYYPGFTIGGGIGEAGSIFAVLVLLMATPYQSGAFLWTLAAFVSLVAMHLIYWFVTRPVNSVWLRGKELKGLSAAFFSFGADKGKQAADWTNLRDIWEYSHVARAVLALQSLILVAVAVTARCV